MRLRFPAGCTLTYTQGRYEHRCPVAIGHKRVGMSVGMIIKEAQCSICGADPSVCPHLPGEQYPAIADRRDGSCTICREPGCDHIPGQEYLARTGRIILEAEIEEVSLVARPQQPDARLVALPMSMTDLRKALGADFKPGVVVECSACLEACAGLERPFG